MAFYFSSDTNALYDTDVFPVASLPENKVEISAAVYAELLTKQNQGYVILADGSGNPYTVNQSEAAATDIKHAASVATTLALGHVKIGNTMQAANDGTLNLNDGAVTTEKIVDGNVTADKLAPNAVETAKIKDANVTTAKIADANVTTVKLADEAVTTSKIADEAVTTAKIADGSVTEAKLDSVKDLLADETTLTLTENTNDFTFSVKDGGITTPKIADGSVTTAKIADSAVTTAKIASQAVTANEIKNETITSNELAAGAVTRQKLASNLVPAVLPFKDENDNDLNGGTWAHTWSDSFDKQHIGNIGSHASGRLIDFILQAKASVQQGSIPATGEFTIIVWHGTGSITSDKIYEERTVNLTDDMPFMRERFTFVTGDSDNIKINILPVDWANRILLSNIQLKGFVF